MCTNVFVYTCVHHYKYLLCKYYYMLQDKKTPLHWASQRGHIDTVTILLANCGDVAAQDEVNEYNLNYIDS